MVSRATQYRPPRELTPEERSTLEFLLARSPNAAAFQAQAASVHAVARCACGCASITLEVGEPPVVPIPAEVVIADANGTTPDGHFFELILFQRDGRLRELEVVWYDVEPPPPEFPPIESIKDVW
jgi:hypothetical protein